jgi:hypothetical protein
MNYKLLITLTNTYPTPATPDELAQWIDMHPDDIQRDCLAMLEPHDLYGPLVELCKTGWRITGVEDFEDSTGGRGYLREACVNPYYPTNIEAFKDECLTGHTRSGKRSTITNAALPTVGGSSGSCRDPEGKAMNTNRRLTVGKEG